MLYHVCVLGVIVALTNMLDIFWGLFSQRSGVVRFWKIFLVSGSIIAYSVTVSISFKLRLIPMVLGVRVSLNTIGVVLVSCCVFPFLFCSFFIALVRSSVLLIGVKYCCISVVLCALLQSWQYRLWVCLLHSESSEHISLILLAYS